MSEYSKIQNQFLRVGHEEYDKLSQSDYNKALDKIGKRNTGLNEFDRSVASQLFERVLKDDNNKAIVKDYIEVILEAHSMLRKNIGVLREQAQIDKSRKNTKTLEELYQFQEDLRLLTVPFGLPEPEPIPQLQGYVDHTQLGLTQRSINIDLSVEGETQYEGKDLIAVFIITCLWLFLDLLSDLTKTTFLNLMTPLAIFGIFLLKCFDKHYMRMCITGIVLSFIFDLIWLLTLGKNYWTPIIPSHRSANLKILYKLAFILTIVTMLLRVIILILIYPYRSNPPETKKKVKFNEIQIKLLGKTQFNPLAHLFTTQGQIFGLK